MTAAVADERFTQQEAAEYCRVCLSTFRKRVHPNVPHYPIGRKPIYLRSDLDRFLTQQVVEPRNRPSMRRGSVHDVVNSSPRAKKLAAELEGEDGG